MTTSRGRWYDLDKLLKELFLFVYLFFRGGGGGGEGGEFGMYFK